MTESLSLRMEPASAVTSLAFVVVGVVLWLTRRRRPDGGARPGVQGTLAVLTVLIGVGSLVQHGPAPAWNPVVHDPPLMGVLALVAADGVADLARRPLRLWWWLGPMVLCLLTAAVEPGWSAALQVVAAVVAAVVTLLRAWWRPPLRPRIVPALLVLAVGGVIGTLSRPGWVWDDAALDGHAVWHVLAAIGIAVLAPALGSRQPHGARR